MASLGGASGPPGHAGILQSPGRMSDAGSDHSSLHLNEASEASSQRGEPAAKRRRAGATGNGNIGHSAEPDRHFSVRFHDVPSTHTRDVFCALEYNRDILDPSIPKMHYLAAEKAHPVPLDLVDSNATKVDSYGTGLMLGCLKPREFCRRREGLHMNPLPAGHPLGVNKRYTAEQQKQRLVNKQQETEALFLRRPILVQNDIFAKGDDIVVGHEAVEKNLPRKPVEAATPEEIASRIEATFQNAKEGAVHPEHGSKVKVKSETPILPNASMWATNFRTVLFDESTNIPFEKENPALLWQESKMGKEFLGLLKPDASKEHKLERAYVWVNAGEWQQSRSSDESEFLLLSLPGKPNKPAKFVQIPNKLRVKKMLAQLQSGSATTADFDIGRKRVEWRHQNKAEEDRDHNKLREVLEEDLSASGGAGLNDPGNVSPGMYGASPGMTQWGGGGQSVAASTFDGGLPNGKHVGNGSVAH
ncbi:unnamed protein product [Amoebophrya sp. A25]|nr:unnamed protein product [Amoebophrya sp. A25]|eukprot:GSA25T00017926001.1